jgi:hypothetical protein
MISLYWLALGLKWKTLPEDTDPRNREYWWEQCEWLAAEGTYICQCCKNESIGSGFYDICTVCGWESDSVLDLDEESGPNHMTLRQGRENFAKYGDCEFRCKHGEQENWCPDCIDEELGLVSP